MVGTEDEISNVVKEEGDKTTIMLFVVALLLKILIQLRSQEPF